jgi:hypothetical protein
MRRKGGFVHYTADELSRLESDTHWAKVDATTREEIERQAGADDGPLPEGWEDTVTLGVPAPNAAFTSVSILTYWIGLRRMAAAIRPALMPCFELLFGLAKHVNLRSGNPDNRCF